VERVINCRWRREPPNNSAVTAWSDAASHGRPQREPQTTASQLLQTHTLRPSTPRPSEPILVPKLRIRFADFPYLHCSTDQRLLTLETCCGYGYGLERESLARSHEDSRLHHALTFSRAGTSASDTTRAVVLLGICVPISG
jgi:hypothetical protein